MDQQLRGRHAVLGITLAYWGESLRRSGDVKAGESKLREALAVFNETLPKNHWRPVETRSLLAMCFVDQRRFAEAEKLLLPAYEALAAQFPLSHPRVAGVAERLAALYDSWGQPQKASQWRSKLKQ
jgi:hypothetical protein